MELAGEVQALGRGAERFAVGDRVMAIVGGGAQAELAVVHERQLMPVPAVLDWPEAGGLPEVFTTAHDAVFTQGELRSGERLLVHGGAGGVGTAAIQLAAAAGARVTATVRREESRAEVAALGAEVDRARGLCRARAVRCDPRAGGSPEPGGRPDGARRRRAHLRDRRLGGREGRAEPARADGQARPHPRLHAARASAGGEGARRAPRWSTRCCRCSRRAG